MHHNFVAGEPGQIRLKVRGFADQPSVDWDGHTIDLLLVDYANTEIVADNVGAGSVENEEANGLDATLWDFDIVAALPADAPVGYHRAMFKVLDGATLVHYLPHVQSALTVRVWEEATTP